MPSVVLKAGSCTRHKVPLWTSDDREDRKMAAAICGWCPVREPCLEWSLIAVPSLDNTIYAGLGAGGRQRLRRAARERMSAAAADEEISSAA